MTEFEDRFTACKAIKDEMERNSCMFGVLYDITSAQDKIQLSIPSVNESIRLALNLVNDANAIILGVSRNRGDIRKIVSEGYVEEKVGKAIAHWNDLVHDLNITLERDWKEKISGELYSYRDKPAPLETRERQKNYLFKGFQRRGAAPPSLFEIIEGLEKEYGGATPVSKVYERASSLGISKKTTEEFLSSESKKGTLYFPRGGSIGRPPWDEQFGGVVSMTKGENR